MLLWYSIVHYRDKNGTPSLAQAHTYVWACARAWITNLVFFLTFDAHFSTFIDQFWMCFLLNWTHVCLRMPRLYTFDPFSCSTVTRFRSDRLGSPEKWSSKGPDKTMTNGRNMALCNGILWRGWVIKETIKETKKETSGPNCEWFLGLNKHVLRTLHLLYMKTHVFFRILRSRTVSFLRHPKHPMHSGRVTLSHTKQETAFLAMIQLILTSTTWAILDFGNQQFHRTPWISMAADLQATASGWNNFFKPTETAIFKIICLVAQFYC